VIPSLVQNLWNVEMIVRTDGYMLTKASEDVKEKNDQVRKILERSEDGLP